MFKKHATLVDVSIVIVAFSESHLLWRNKLSQYHIYYKSKDLFIAFMNLL